MSQKLHGEELQKEIKELKKFKSMQVEKDQLYTLSQELLGTKVPSSSYPVFLFKQFIWFKLRAVKEGRPYEIATSTKFLETFLESDFEDLEFAVWALFAWIGLPFGPPFESYPFLRWC